MSGKAKIVLWGMLAVLVLLPALVRTNVARAVYLKATFRDLQGTPPDKILSDGKGPYQNASDLTVMFDDLGELQFVIGSRAGRRVNFIFDSILGPGPCGVCAGESPPDTSCTIPGLLDEPVTYVSFRTTISSSHAGPQLNFLAMSPGEVKPVRLSILFETKARKYFYVKYYYLDKPEEYCDGGGPVTVQALDMSGDGTVDRWVIDPVQTSADKALLFKGYHGKGNDWVQCSFGYFRMPFGLTLDRK